MSLFDYFQTSELFLKVLKEYFAKISVGKAGSTIEKYGYFYSAVESFMIGAGLSKIQCHRVKVKTMENFRNFMHSKKHMSQEHVSRHIEHCQAAMDYAVLMEYVKFNPIAPIKGIRDKVKEPVSLTKFEVIKLMNYEPKSEKWNLVRDLFLFQCFTGLSYMDLWIFEIETDTIIEKGEEIPIEFVTSKHGRGKNNKPYSAEFNCYARIIKNRYPNGFGRITVQGYNRIIKKIFFALNFREELCKEGTTHNGRKTYSTLRFRQGMTLEGLADEMGNTPDMLRTRYITKSRDRIKRDILSLGESDILGLPNKSKKVNGIGTII